MNNQQLLALLVAGLLSTLGAACSNFVVFAGDDDDSAGDDNDTTMLVAVPQSNAGEKQIASAGHTRAVFYITHHANGRRCESLERRRRDIEHSSCCPEGFSEVGLKVGGTVQRRSSVFPMPSDSGPKPPKVYPEVVCLQDR